MSPSIIEIPGALKERIFQAANDLYEQAERQRFPSVDQVRRYAQVDMNAASSVMKEWRRAQTVQATPVAILVPEAIAQANSQFIAMIWTQAQELANENLRSAKISWDAERSEFDEMRQELAQAYEAQALELEQLKAEYVISEKSHQDVAKELANVKIELSQAVTQAERAEVQVCELDRRVTELRNVLDKVNNDKDGLRIELSLALTRADKAEATLVEIERRANEFKNQLNLANADFDTLRAELDDTKSNAAQALAKAEATSLALIEKTEQLNKALKTAATAREHAAELLGKISALQDQNSALLSRLVPEIEGE